MVSVQKKRLCLSFVGEPCFIKNTRIDSQIRIKFHQLRPLGLHCSTDDSCVAGIQKGRESGCRAREKGGKFPSSLSRAVTLPNSFSLLFPTPTKEAIQLITRI